VATSEAQWIEPLASNRATLDRESTAQRVAEVLRTRITEGVLVPGTRLSEGNLSAALGVSRNTLRESFRLLSQEGLLVHELNRGVFVQTLTLHDLHDIYRVRRIIEIAAVQSADRATPAAIDRVREAVEFGERVSAEHDWAQAGTANMHFHQALAGLVGSSRLDEMMRGVLAQLRLAFHVQSPRDLHEPYIAGNRQIYQLLAIGETISAAAALAAYLDLAERQLVGAYAARDTERSLAKVAPARAAQALVADVA
jgi:DNA-binding GntR family transcriptional regulator